MKVLTHNGVLLTLPAVLDREDAFLRLDGKGTAAVGIVGELDDSAVEQKAQEGAAIEDLYSTPQEIKKDLKFISQQLMDVAEGAEIRVQWRRGGVGLVVPPEARAERPAIKAKDRVRVQRPCQPESDAQRPRDRGERHARESHDKARRGRPPAPRGSDG
jgi:hypothetical protein